MALVQASSAAGGFVELEIGNSVESLVRLLDSQRELFHSQVDQLQKLIVTQCKLTGVNPLSQEMAAGALSIKIGKRPRDLLNPKAIKYMQSVFSIKDTIGKKETREISALCGVTVSQVREYFAGQRSRVRKLVCLPKEKAIRSDASKASNNGTSFNSDQILPTKESVMNSLELRVAEECTQVTGNSMKHSSSESLQVPESSGDFNTAPVGLQDSVNSTDLKPIQEVPSCSSQDESIPGVDSDDKKFLANIFNLMRKEETFSGQVKLMEWVLQIHNSAVLHWFLTKGGLTILATWLSQAAFEEQTSVLLVFFKVLCHLPLHKALPVQMSAILQTVNRLRFYRISDISNRARILLSRWSKLFVRSQALKKPSLMNSNDAEKEMLRRQRISEILSDDSWQSRIDIHEEILALDGTTENSRRSEPRKGQKLLMESRDESKKHGRSVSSPKMKERRKVLLVEQPDRKTTDRNVLVARVVPSNHSRPMSADDIQKAKMRAIFLQDKYGKADASTSEIRPLKTEDHKPLHASQANHRLPASRIYQLHQLRRENHKKFSVTTSETSAQKLETSINSKAGSSQGQLWEKVKRNQLPWQTPPEMRVNCLWKVGAGENSKEVEVQTQRNRREKETFYPSAQDVPLNPKEPWDLEMDLDDSLTPEIPNEQPPEADAAAESSSCSPSGNRGATNDATTATTSAAPPISNGATEPDLELLAVLLKNPELVIALTSGQGKSLSSQETVALLDTLKKSGAGLAGLMSGVAGGSKEKSAVPDPTSLPSPTPPSEATTNVWRSEFPTPTKVPVLQPHFAGGRGSTAHPTAIPHALSAAPVHVAVKSQAPVLGLLPQAPTTVLSMPQLMVSIDAAPQQLPPLNFLPKRLSAPMPHQTSAPIYPLQQSPNPQAILPPMQHYPVTNGPALPISVSQREPYSQPALLPTPLRLQPQPPLLADPPTWLPWDASVGRREPTLDSRIVGDKGLLDFPIHNPHFHTNQLNYNIYHKGSVQPHMVHPSQALGRNGILDGSELETWSPEGSPVRSPEIRSNLNFPEQRRELGRDYRPEWSNSKQWNPGHCDRHQSGGSKRWRDRNRDRDRDRDGGGRSRRR